MFPTDLASFLEFVRQHGPAAYSFVFAFASSHALLWALFAGYAAHAGALNIGAVIVVSFIGSLVGDAVRFWIGRRYGESLLVKFPSLARPARTVIRLAEQHYPWMILTHRYPHGVRGVAGFAYGMSRLSWPIFMLYNALAAALWAAGITGLGYAFGHVSDKVMQDASSKAGTLLLVLFLGLSWWISRRLDKAMEKG